MLERRAKWWMCVKKRDHVRLKMRNDRNYGLNHWQAGEFCCWCVGQVCCKLGCWFIFLQFVIAPLHVSWLFYDVFSMINTGIRWILRINASNISYDRCKIVKKGNFCWEKWEEKIVQLSLGTEFNNGDGRRKNVIQLCMWEVKRRRSWRKRINLDRCKSLIYIIDWKANWKYV